MTEIHWTEAGRKHAAANGIATETVEEILRRDIASGQVHPSKLISHAIMPKPGDPDLVFGVGTTEDGQGLLIDATRWVRCTMEDGPFKGRAVLRPAPLSEGEA